MPPLDDTIEDLAAEIDDLLRGRSALLCITALSRVVGRIVKKHSIISKEEALQAFMTGVREEAQIGKPS